MKIERIIKANEIIDYAIKNKCSIKSSCVKFGYNPTYVKNVKGDIIKLYNENLIENTYYEMFISKYNEYKLQNNISTEDNSTNTKKNVSPDETNYSSNSKFSNAGNEAEYEWKGSSNYPIDHIKTLDELLAATKVDTDVWKVKDFVVNKWDVTSTRGDVPKTYQNFQIKARLEKIIEILRYKQAAEIFKEMVANYVPPVFGGHAKENIIEGFGGENNLLEISIFDLHMGKLAWAGETGENYDTKIASSRFMETIQTLLERANGFNFNRILFPIGNDFFNSDTILNTTTGGTPQDEDLRWQKTFKVGARLIVDGINLLKQTGVPVDVIVIPGNHDFERSFYLGEFLDAFFHNDTQVSINNDASPRKYYKFGKVLLGFTHGNEEKESSLPLIMANDIESKPLWSITNFHEWHLGHIHRKRNVKYAIVDKKMMINEDLGVTVRYLSSLTGTEEWHHKKGFIGAIKAADAFIWNDNLGLIAHINSNLTVK